MRIILSDSVKEIGSDFSQPTRINTSLGEMQGAFNSSELSKGLQLFDNLDEFAGSAQKIFC